MRAGRSTLTRILTIALPILAVIGSVDLAIVAFSNRDPTRPGQYYSQGDKLNQEFAKAARPVARQAQAPINEDPRPSKENCDTPHSDGVESGSPSCTPQQTAHSCELLRCDKN
jgi:hypothetical protein